MTESDYYINIKGYSLIHKYPDLFGNVPFDPSETMIWLGIDIKKEWFDILYKDLIIVNDYVRFENMTDFRILQIKQKDSDLFIDINTDNLEIKDILNTIKQKCYDYK